MDRNAPPPGCTQYFTGALSYLDLTCSENHGNISGATGFIQSYNYAGGLHLANQDYSACVRTERGYCSIGYTATDATSFQISSQNPNTATDTGAYVGDSCTTDYIEVMPTGLWDMIRIWDKNHN